jgi:hypothetical protein
MVERIYDTLKGILYNDLPKNAKDQVVVYDRPIIGWYFGDRDVKPSSLSLIFYGTSIPLKDVSLGLQEYEHKITIGVDAGADNVEVSERLVLEATRLVLSVLRRHRRMWVLEPCPICGKFMLSPQHYAIDHTAIFSSYSAAAQASFDDQWAETHDASVVAPSLPASGLAAESFLRVYEAVGSGTTVTGLTANARKNILQMRNDYVDPIRILYDVTCNDIKPSDDGRSQALLKNGTITVTAKELVKQTIYGPDNVPTTAF